MSKVFTITEGLENLGALKTGGQGSVYKGKRTGTIFSAVKLIPTPITSEDHSDKNYRNFENEVAKLQKVNENPSPNVVKMLSFGITESGAFPYIEMEYIEGPDLCDLLKTPHEKIFVIKELVKVAGQLAAALAHCHQMGVKHGDIKSNNVKYNVNTGNYVLLDFGLAIMSEEQRRTSIRHAGAIEFMAPEQNEGKMLFQTDIYSFGIILYELLAGQVPFPLHGNSDTARNTVMVNHMENDLPDIMELRKSNLPQNWSEEQKEREMQVPAWLLGIVDKCLQKDPKNRFKDGMALQDSLTANSISASPKTNQDPDIALKAENKELKHKIAQLKSGPRPAPMGGIVLSKFAFTTMLLALIGFMAFAGYMTFVKKENTQQQANLDTIENQVDTTTTAEQDRLQNEAMIPKQTKQVKNIDSAKMAEEELDGKVDSTEDLTPDTTIKQDIF